MILLVLLPLFALGKRQTQLVGWLVGAISTMVSNFAVVFLSTIIFGWLSLEYSLLPLTVMFVSSSLNVLARLARFRGTEGFALEVSYGVGETSGFILGAMYFVYLVPLKVIVYIATLPVIVFACCLLISRQKTFPFWKLASDMPDEAYEFFLSEPCWAIYDPPSRKQERPSGRDYTGPFFLHVPSLGRRIAFYGKSDLIEESQRRFIERHSNALR